MKSVLVTIGNRRLHQHVLSGTEGCYRNDQLRQIPKRRVEQPTYRITRLFGDGFGCMAEKGSKRNDCEDGEYQQERVSGGHNPCRDQHGWHKYQHPQQRGMLNFP
jgi:hypothetical protein